MRYYVLNVLKGTAATPYVIEVFACGAVEAFAKAREMGYWPLSVERSGWYQTIEN